VLIPSPFNQLSIGNHGITQFLQCTGIHSIQPLAERPITARAAMLGLVNRWSRVKIQ